MAIIRRGETEKLATRDRAWDPFDLMQDLVRWDPFREMSRALTRGDVGGFIPSFEVKETRDATYEETDEKGVAINRTLGIAHLGGATLDNEENYLIKKLFTSLGIVQIENQARI
jgi:hypothetical protein